MFHVYATCREHAGTNLGDRCLQIIEQAWTLEMKLLGLVLYMSWVGLALSIYGSHLPVSSHPSH